MLHVCLNMIVRDEGAVIERCLDAVLPYIDSWCIVDTGSTDDTREKIKKKLEAIPGSLHEREWVDFATNRTEALALAREEDAEYVLFLDADDVWAPAEDFAWPDMDRDAYYVKLLLGDLSWDRIAVVKNDRQWSYKNVRHEAVVCDGPVTTGDLPGAVIQCRQDGARRSASPDWRAKYRDDAAALEKQVAEQPWNLRAIFYLAQSYRDAGHLEKAAEYYERRASAGGWEEEQWWAMLQLGYLHQAMGSPWAEAESWFLRAYHLRPHRAEPLVALSDSLRKQSKISEAHLYACTAVDTPYPEGDRLFVSESTYRWRALDEYAVTAFYLGKVEQAREANERLLELVPRRERSRIRANLAFCTTDDEQGDPIDEEVKAAARHHGHRLARLHQQYTGTVSTEAMAASLEACALAYALCESISAGHVVDLGSGYSSAVLRGGPWHVDSVDDDAQWLTRTRDFLAENELETGSLWTAEQFFSLPKGSYDFIFMDLGHTPGRADHLAAAWERLREGGLLLIDDIHHVTYRTRVEDFLEGVPHERINVNEETRDRFGRYAWLVRRAAA